MIKIVATYTTIHIFYEALCDSNAKYKAAACVRIRSCMYDTILPLRTYED